jgi:MFS family permease
MRYSALRLPNFRWLWFGQTLIFCGSQFWFVTLTWLILQKTGSGLAIGTVLMAAAIPRGLLMLMGGAISDRLPTHRVAAIAATINAILVALVLVLLLGNKFNLGGMVVMATLFGVSEAFLYPAMLALLPQLMSKSRLGAANAWMQGSEQLTNVIGPAAAGLVIGAWGLPPALGVNALLFILGGGCIYLIRHPCRRTPDRPQTVSLAAEILAGLRYAWYQPAIRLSLQLIAMINFAVLGPMIIGVAELVALRFGNHATTFGGLQAAYGVGALLGVGVAGQLSAIKNLKTPLIWLAQALGVGLIVLGFSQQAWMAAIVMALMGLGGGIVGVLGLTWLQQQTVLPMQGRMMSLVMFAAVALDPLSQAISGMLLEINLTGLFVAAGGVMLLTAVASSWQPE